MAVTGGTPAFAARLRRPGAACGLSCLPPPLVAFETAPSAPESLSAPPLVSSSFVS